MTYYFAKYWCKLLELLCMTAVTAVLNSLYCKVMERLTVNCDKVITSANIDISKLQINYWVIIDVGWDRT